MNPFHILSDILSAIRSLAECEKSCGQLQLTIVVEVNMAWYILNKYITNEAKRY